MFAHLNPHSSDFEYISALYSPFVHQLTMQFSLFEPGHPVSVIVCVARKLNPCPSYSRRRDCINLGIGRSLYKGGGSYSFTGPNPACVRSVHMLPVNPLRTPPPIVINFCRPTTKRPWHAGAAVIFQQLKISGCPGVLLEPIKAVLFIRFRPAPANIDSVV